MKKEIGVVGLGKMGGAIVRRLHEQGWKVVGFDVSDEARNALKAEGVHVTETLNALIETLPTPRVVWLMLPAGDITERTVLGESGLAPLLAQGDTVIDAANSFYEDTTRRAALLNEKGIHFVDVGFSGGPSGARNGGCLMVGGEEKIVQELAPLFEALALPEGWVRCAEVGAGHFTKMVHNGIEYGMMQSLAEGFAVLKQAPFPLDLLKIARIYNRGSVIESRLVGWAESGFTQFGVDLEGVSGTVAHTGEGKWTVETAKKLGVPVPSIELAYNFRVESEKHPSYIGKVLSMLRNQFGGHAAKK